MKEENTVEQCKTELMARVLQLLGDNQLDLQKIFQCKLAPVPTSMFEDAREARYAISKSDLMNKLKVEVLTLMVLNHTR